MDGVNGQGGFGGGQGGYGGQGPYGGAGGANFGDFFGDMFNRGGGFGQQTMQKMKIEPTLLEYQVTLDDLFYGKTVEIAYHKTKTCGTCDGKGGKNVQTCGTCHGQGFVFNTRNMGGMTM
jgi:molecular chaperone DnaJ